VPPRGTSPFSSRSGPRRRLRPTEDNSPPPPPTPTRDIGGDLTQPRILPCDPNYLARAARGGKKSAARGRAGGRRNERKQRLFGMRRHAFKSLRRFVSRPPPRGGLTLKDDALLSAARAPPGPSRASWDRSPPESRGGRSARGSARER